MELRFSSPDDHRHVQVARHRHPDAAQRPALALHVPEIDEPLAVAQEQAGQIEPRCLQHHGIARRPHDRLAVAPAIPAIDDAHLAAAAGIDDLDPEAVGRSEHPDRPRHPARRFQRTSLAESLDAGERLSPP
jgi:hypothetical protein